MKILSALILFALLLSGCEKDKGLPEANQGQQTIQQGVSGTLLFREGNCMPIINPDECKEYPVKRKVYIFEAAKQNDAVPAGSDPGFYSSVNTGLVTIVESNSTGFFQVVLDPGHYSLFIKEENKLWANGFDGQGYFTPVTITENSVSERNIVIDYKAVY